MADIKNIISADIFDNSKEKVNPAPFDILSDLAKDLEEKSKYRVFADITTYNGFFEEGGYWGNVITFRLGSNKFDNGTLPIFNVAYEPFSDGYPCKIAIIYKVKKNIDDPIEKLDADNSEQFTERLNEIFSREDIKNLLINLA